MAQLSDRIVKKLLSDYKIPVPQGEYAETPDDAAKLFEKINRPCLVTPQYKTVSHQAQPVPAGSSAEIIEKILPGVNSFKQRRGLLIAASISRLRAARNAWGCAHKMKELASGSDGDDLDLQQELWPSRAASQLPHAKTHLRALFALSQQAPAKAGKIANVFKLYLLEKLFFLQQ